MRRRWLWMNKRIFSGPFLVFMLCGTIIPLGVIAFYGMTDRSGNFTLDNITAIATGEHWQALMLALGLALISTITVSYTHLSLQIPVWACIMLKRRR